MQHQYPYSFINGHIIAMVLEEGRNLLIDTGSPVTIANEPTVEIAGREFRAVLAYGAATPAMLTREIGIRVDALIGTDMLNTYDIRFSPEEEAVTFSDEEFDVAGERLPLEFLAGIPIVTATVGCTPARMFFDTGAQLSYLVPELTRGCEQIDTVHDFYPAFGRFETPVFEVPVVLGRTKLILRAGHLPALLRTALMQFGTEGILGSALIERRPVHYAPRRRFLAV